ncbi:photosynthetic complex putative assembly protein PuhB [Rhodovulum tesquicola]|uniref:photosynthetic complex putative assembly protein PuhB n=1 Tax=Rhodovulum tesquicola TaxID=540254 RepID=UPI00209767BC|nr:photosynthetic complex putative assembly protein PuhB [Rhodovulum tesquicola]MCO8143846.1 photosynthetic complex putative assembly protein PuhB [Rhodovulum tesquicola]
MSHDDFDVEPIKGLPEHLPEGEHILWQGSPDWWVLARESLALYWVGGYFVVLYLWRVIVATETMSLPQAAVASSFFLVLGAVVCALLAVTSLVQAKAAVYTVTNRRVALRIGAALTMTLNLPYTWIGNANLDLRKSGTGTIAFELMGTTRFSYLLCWPHVRPWRIARTEPAFRCIPDAAKVARLIAEAAETRVSEPKIARVPDEDALAAE